MFNMLLNAGSSGISVTSALETGSELFTWVVGLVTTNAILCASFVIGVLAPAATKLFNKLKKTAK